MKIKISLNSWHALVLVGYLMTDLQLRQTLNLKNQEHVTEQPEHKQPQHTLNLGQSQLCRLPWHATSRCMVCGYVSAGIYIHILACLANALWGTK